MKMSELFPLKVYPFALTSLKAQRKRECFRSMAHVSLFLNVISALEGTL